MEELRCTICMESFESSGDHQPATFCRNGHVFCISHDFLTSCPVCRDNLLPKSIPNRLVMSLVESLADKVDLVLVLNSDEFEIEEKEFASGGYGKIYRGKWNGSEVAIKKIGVSNKEELSKIFRECRLCAGLSNPYVVRMFGVLKPNPLQMDIVMELYQQNLRQAMLSLTEIEKVRVCLGICRGLMFLHSKKVAHLDLKPENILLDAHKVPKIGDFGLSRVLQTINVNSTLIGTPAYSPPELLEDHKNFDESADIYTFSMIIWEIFAGERPFKDFKMVQIITAVLIKNQRPDINKAQFPSTAGEDLKELVTKGWSADRCERPALSKFHSLLEKIKQLLEPEQSPVCSNKVPEVVSIRNRLIPPTIPMPSFGIDISFKDDTEFAKKLRESMIEDIISKSSFSGIVNDLVLQAMKRIPRHLFMYKSRMVESSEDEMIRRSYKYSAIMAASETGSCSAPEILAAQLSLIKIENGYSVLFLGAKSGYIQSICSQIVGYHGDIVVASCNQNGLNLCQGRINKFSPFAKTFSFKSFDSLKEMLDPVYYVDVWNQFQVVVIAGSISQVPEIFLKRLLVISGACICPVGELGSQKLVYVEKVSDSELTTKIFSDWGVRFGGLADQ